MRMQHGGSVSNWGDHSSITIRPISSSETGIMSSTAETVHLDGLYLKIYEEHSARML